MLLLGETMAGSKEVRYIVQKANINNAQLAELLHMTRQVVHNKLVRDTFTYADLLEIADLLWFELKLVIEKKTPFEVFFCGWNS